MIAGFFIACILLLLVSAVVVPAGTLGVFERKRREREKNDIEVERELYHGDITSIFRVLTALLLVVATVFSVASFGWLFGIVIALILALEYGALARLRVVRSFAMKYYPKIEPKLFAFIQAYPGVMRFIRVFTPDVSEVVLHSREELQHLIANSQGVVATNEQKLLLAAMAFPDTVIKEVMTPRSVIEAVNKVELLGPVVLDDLHKKGYSRLPVIENDVDHIVGMLHLRDVLTVDTAKKHTPRVESVMEKRVFYIHEDQTLEHALNAFIKTHHHLFVVVNEYRETVGLLSLEDVIESLIGREIVDEFDEHNDLRAVAMRNPRGNNQSANGQDI